MSNVLSNLFDALLIILDRIDKGYTSATSHFDVKSMKSLISKGRGSWTYKEAMTAYSLYQSYRSRVPFGPGVGAIYRPQPKDFNSKNPKKVFIEESHISFYYPFDLELTETLRKSMSLTWHTKTSSFRVKTSYENIKSALQAVVDHDFEIDSASLKYADKMANIYNQNILDSNSSTSNFEIKGIHGELYPYQRAGVEYALRSERCLIADAMGLGKTVQALATIESANAYPCIIVAPASLKLNWEKEVKKWIPQRSTIVMNMATKPTELKGKDFIIINYEILYDARTTSGNKFKKIPYLSVIFDESHYVKSKEAKRTEASIRLARKAKFKICLTGTPIVNRPNDLIPQLQILDRLHDFGGWEQFVKRYCDAKKTGFGWDISGSSNLEELNAKLRATCFVRREKHDVLKELPLKNRIIVPMEMKPFSEYHDLLDMAKRSVLRQIGLSENVDMESLSEAKRQEIKDLLNETVLNSSNMVEIDALKLAVAKSKMENVIAWIKNFLDNGEKLVVFAYHKDIQNKLLQIFRKAARIISGDSQSEREAQKEMFMTDPKCKLLIGGMGNITSSPAGMGHTLTVASNVAFVEFGWNSAIHDQSEDRVHRIGQTADSVNIYYLLVEGTVEEEAVRLIEEKRKMVEQSTVGGHMVAVKEITNDLAKFLFS